MKHCQVPSGTLENRSLEGAMLTAHAGSDLRQVAEGL